MGRPRKATSQKRGEEVGEPRVVSLLRATHERAMVPPPPAGMTTGRVVRLAPEGNVWVELSEESLTLLCLNAAALRASEVGEQVVVWRALDATSIAIARVTPVLDAALPANDEAVREAVIDGRRVVLEAADEIVLRCGRASIVLRRNGRVQIKGAYVETSSEGVNRIKGGTVQIN